MNRTMRQRPQWSWFRKKELEQLFQRGWMVLSKRGDVKNAFFSSSSAPDHLYLFPNSAHQDIATEEILPTEDITDDYFIDLFKQGYI